MSVGWPARCEGERFPAATSLPEAVSATSYLLFLSGIEEHSAFLAPVCLFFLAGKRLQRSCVFKLLEMTYCSLPGISAPRVAKPWKLEERGKEAVAGALTFLAGTGCGFSAACLSIVWLSFYLTNFCCSFYKQEGWLSAVHKASRSLAEKGEG